MQLTDNEILLKKACEDSQMAFSRFAFKEIRGQKFIINQHHPIIARTLDRVISGEIKRLVINIPPGYTKTEMAVIHFIARGIAINPRARFIHMSYADNLVKLNSSAVLDTIRMPEYQKLWPMKLRRDTKSKGLWSTEHAGGMLASTMKGVVTGFRAGLMQSDQLFTGALIIDDPIKPSDAYSKNISEKVNAIFNNTLKSRLATPEVPVILIMQRLTEEDPSNFLLNGGTGEEWHHLLLPAEIGPEYTYPENKYTHSIPVEYDLPDGALWPMKATVEQLKEMRDAAPYDTSAQYDQVPTPLGGGIFKDWMWKYYNWEVPPPFEYRFTTADTALKDGEQNDYSVMMCFGVAENKLYLVDILRVKVNSDQIERIYLDFWTKHNYVTTTSGRLRLGYVEDKASGTQLIQGIQTNYSIPIEAVQRGTNKVTRAMDLVNFVSSGYVYLPEGAPFLSDFKNEMRVFSPVSTSHDDQVDAFMDGIEKGLGQIKNEARGFSMFSALRR
jgi:predicted phage terminase large subunit-like protein